MNSYEEVSIVIVSYRSKRKIIKFLKKIYKYKKIIVIENSDDLSIGFDINKIYKNVEVYHTNNIGYGCSANYARKKINTEYFFLFNPDLEEVDSVLIEYFLEYGKKLNNQFSCLGPRYKNINKKTLKQSNINDEIGSIKAISGAAMFFNCNKFDLIGGFDENFFLYFEETEYCYRAKKKGYFSYQINDTKVRVKGRSVDLKSENFSNILIWHFIWSKYYYYKSKYGKITSILIFVPIIIRIILRLLFYKILKDKKNFEKYKFRLNGLISSVLGKKSSLRP